VECLYHNLRCVYFGGSTWWIQGVLHSHMGPKDPPTMWVWISRVDSACRNSHFEPCCSIGKRHCHPGRFETTCYLLTSHIHLSAPACLQCLNASQDATQKPILAQLLFIQPNSKATCKDGEQGHSLKSVFETLVIFYNEKFYSTCIGLSYNEYVF
jgi:hypothetical protein